MKLVWAVAVSLMPCVLAANANAQNCFTGPIKTKDGSLQTWTVVNRCGAPVTMQYSLKRPDGNSTKSAIVPACSRQRIIQTFETDQIEFLGTAYGVGWEKICPSSNDEIRFEKRLEKSINGADQIPFPSMSPPPLAGPAPIGSAGRKSIP